MFKKFEKNVTKLKKITQEDMVEAEPSMSEVSEVVSSSDIEDDDPTSSAKKLKENKNKDKINIADYKVGKNESKNLGGLRRRRWMRGRPRTLVAEPTRRTREGICWS